MMPRPFSLLYFSLLFLLACQPGPEEPHNGIDPLDNYTDWAIYRGDKKGNQYAELGQINAANVQLLRPVWEYHTGDADERSSMQCNPIIVDGLLYVSTPTLKAVAIDAASGEEAWVFESSEYNKGGKVFRGRSRGVTYWKDPEKSDDSGTIFHFVKDRVYALHAKTGELLTHFGEGGYIDLRKHLGMDTLEASIEVTTPGIVYDDFLIVTSRVPEGFASTPGDVRAYDARTGEFRWIFHTIPREGEFGYDTWDWVEGETYGGANAWGGLTVDEARGWVFFATGSPTYDFYGAYRKGQNLFGNSVLALDIRTGKRIWHYQTVHHDIWDYDNPPAPILVTLTGNSDTTDAVVQLTKMGLTFVLDRETGEPLFPVVETPVPRSRVPGEETWPTQPIPLKPPPLVRQGLTEADLSRITPEAFERALEQFRQFASGPIYTPPTVQGTITTPGHQGGVEWGGGAFDPYLQVLYVNVNDAPSLNRLRRVEDLGGGNDLTLAEKGSLLYQKNCMMCHGSDKQGVPPTYPPLHDLQITRDEMRNTIRDGKGIMPAFTQFAREELDAVMAYLEEDTPPINEEENSREPNAESRVRYLIRGYDFFDDKKLGVPASAPPWGTLNAIDLIGGDILWKVPLGEYPQLVDMGIRHTGTKNFGGPVATAGGIVFIAATADDKIRAFEKHSGKVLWEYQLPAGGVAVPSTYMIDGKQYLVIVAGGGGKNATRSADAIIAFALPDDPYPEMEWTARGPSDTSWVKLFDGKTLEGWVHMNGSHTFTAENGVIVGRTDEGSENSFLCTNRTFGDFELELEVWIDSVTNSGIQFRSRARPVSIGKHNTQRAGRVYGPQLEIRRNQGPDDPTTGVLYGEALGTGWLTSEEDMQNGRDHYNDQAWNKLRIKAEGPRLRTWVNGHLIEDMVNEEVYKTHPSGFIGLQIHGIDGQGPFVMKWRDIRIRPLP